MVARRILVGRLAHRRLGCGDVPGLLFRHVGDRHVALGDAQVLPAGVHREAQGRDRRQQPAPVGEEKAGHANPSAARVFGPTTPSTASPWACCTTRTAASVVAPKSPSARTGRKA